MTPTQATMFPSPPPAAAPPARAMGQRCFVVHCLPGEATLLDAVAEAYGVSVETAGELALLVGVRELLKGATA
jgi:hypothetical protein